MDWYYILSGIAGLVAILSALLYAARHVWKFTNKVDVFFDDWYGKPASPGHPVRKGVMVRLADQDDVLEYLKTEVSLNSGKTMKDQVVRSSGDILEIRSDIKAIKAHLGEAPNGTPHPPGAGA